jgi:ribosomal-protein-alanine N-acetyltransferase
MNVLGRNREQTRVRPIEQTDLPALLRLIEWAWRVHLRLPPTELRDKIREVPGFLAEDRIGLRGFMIVEPQPTESGLIIAAGLNDSWSVKAYLEALLPALERVMLDLQLPALVHIGHSSWLNEELERHSFAIREWVVTFERLGTQPPAHPALSLAQIRTAHFSDLPALSLLDELAFDHIWHKPFSNFREALAKADSFAVALVEGQIVAYEWCEVYGQHAHLTRLAVHPAYQGRGIGAQLLYQAISDVLEHGANLITLNTQENNARSQALYKRFGFMDTPERIPILQKKLA